MTSALASLAATLVALGEPASAPAPPADDLPLALSWLAPETCPDADSERAEIRRRVGVIDPTHVPELVAAEVEIRASAAGAFVLSLRTRVGETAGERSLTGEDCRPLADAAALVLALLINPQASVGPAPPTVTAPPPVTAPPAPPADDDATFDQHARFGMGLDAVMAFGVLPGPAAGLAGRGFFRHGRLVVMARAGGFFAKDKPAAVLPGASASYYVLESALTICARTLPGRRLGAMLCLGPAVERLHGSSSGVSSPGEASAFWACALAEAAGQLRLTRRTRLRLAAEARGLGSRPDFAILGLGTVYRPAAVSLRGALGVEVLF
jgi:hypothetical protein